MKIWWKLLLKETANISEQCITLRFVARLTLKNWELDCA